MTDEPNLPDNDEIDEQDLDAAIKSLSSVSSAELVDADDDMWQAKQQALIDEALARLYEDEISDPVSELADESSTEAPIDIEGNDIIIEVGSVETSDVQATDETLAKSDEPSLDNSIGETVDSEETADEPSEPYIPEWKRAAQQIYEERQAKHKKMLEDRAKYEAERQAQRQAHLQELADNKIEIDTEIRENLRQIEREKQQAVEDMMEKIRAEKEQKRLEREAMDAVIRAERERKEAGSRKDLSSRTNRLSKEDD